MKKLAEDFQLQIADPCHEDWEKMLPDEKGKFCLSCQKAVYDFTHKTREEIIEFFRQRKFESVCGRVKTNVLNQPAMVQQETFNRRRIYRLAWFAYALFLVFGSTLFSCNMPVQENQQHDLTATIMSDPLIENADTAMPKNASPLPAHPTKKAGLRQQFIATFQDTFLLPEVVIAADNYFIEGKITSGALVSHYVIRDEGQVNNTPFSHSPLGKDKEEEKPATSLQTPFLEIYPNPSSGQFNVRFNLTKPADVELDVFNISGQFIQRVIVSEGKKEGEYIEPVNLDHAAAGIYFLRLRMNDEVLTQRLVIAE